MVRLGKPGMDEIITVPTLVVLSMTNEQTPAPEEDHVILLKAPLKKLVGKS